MRTQEKVYVKIEKGTNINRVTKEEDFYVNEDIENINSQINSLKSYIDQQEKTVNELAGMDILNMSNILGNGLV